jgi:hypothetical protein
MSARKPLLPADADGEARVRFTVDLPRSLHKRLKLAAVDRESVTCKCQPGGGPPLLSRHD